MAFSSDIKRRIIADNLHTQEKELSATLEARRSHLADLASVLLLPYADRPLTAENIRAIGEDALLTGGEIGVHRVIREDVREDIITTMQTLLVYDRAVLATMIVRQLSLRGQVLTPDDFLPTTVSLPRVAYVRNAYTEEAFDAFSSAHTGATSLFTDSYEEACRSVASGEAGYCILPWRDTFGAYHRATLGMLEIFGLVAVSHVTVTDGEDVPMQYALVARTPVAVRTPWEMVLALPDAWRTRMDELTVALPHLGVRLCGLLYEPDSTAVLCTIRGDGSPVALFVWLCLFVDMFDFRGYYPYTEENEI